MRLPAFRRVKMADRVTELLAGACAEVFDALRKVEILDGRLVADVQIGTSAGDIPHALGRAFRGWFVVRNATNATVYEGTSQTDATKYVTLRASAGCRVSLWVF